MADRGETWAGVDSPLAKRVSELSAQTLAAYGKAPRLIEEHHNLERAAVEGGYGRRQLYELVQNGADELLGASGRIEVVVTEDYLYCANQGNPLSVDGVGALLYSHLSAKRGTEIGRFGLGFKSVLGITDSPELFSRTGSFRFGPGYASSQIEAALGERPAKVPALRLAEALDPRAEMDEDATLAELAAWATTVVRLRRTEEESTWLEQDLGAFPTQFLLFSPHVAELVLDDRVNERRRSIVSRSDGDALVLDEGGMETRWRVFSTIHEPSARARADAGQHADRDEIPLVWAVPTARGGRGEFWAFFPTIDFTTLSGVVNAPWKLNEDRTHIIEGTFNQELIESLGTLVLDNLEELVSDADPGVVLDLMPARGRETAGWADKVLTDYLNDRAGYEPSIPDQAGELELPSTIKLHPPDVPRSVLDLWATAPDRPSGWAHPSVESRDRRACAVTYMKVVGRGPESVESWLEALTAGKGHHGAAIAMRVAADLLIADDATFRDGVQAARIVPVQDEGLVALKDGAVFLAADLGVEVDTRNLDESVTEIEGVLDAARVLGIREVDPLLVLASILEKNTDGWQAPEWSRFWDLARRANETLVHQLLSDTKVVPGRLQVRTASGDWARLSGVLEPGEIIPRHSENDRGSLIDTTYHREELGLLHRLGLTAGPTGIGGGTDEPWFAGYRDQAVQSYLARLRAHGASPNRTLIDFRKQRFAGPLTPLRSLSDDTKARYCAALLAAAEDLRPWRIHHTTKADYAEHEWPNPLVWMIREEGLLKTSLGPRAVDNAVGPGLRAWAASLPVAEVSDEAAAMLQLPNVLDDLSEDHWLSVLAGLDAIDRDADIGAAYAAAAAHGIARPDDLRCRVGKTLDRQSWEAVAVTDDDLLARIFIKTGQPYIQVPEPDQCAVLVREWGLREAADAVRTEVAWVAAGEPEPLIDLFPLLRVSIDADHREIQVQPCGELRVETVTDHGKIVTDKLVTLDGEILYRRADTEDHDFLRALSSELGLDLQEPAIEKIVQNLESKRIKDLRKAIREGKSDARRLLLAVGADELRRGLPSALLEAVGEMYGEPTDEQIAELALVVHGPRAVQEYRGALEAAGLAPPARWAGGRAAVEFVRDLGFPSEYAGFPTNKPEATLVVEGRPLLGPLHVYQEEIVGAFRELIAAGGNPRGLLSLPTGAGKTRVTVEALIRSIADGDIESPLLWIAQTEELCEQAVQSWGELWRAFGPAGEALTISRLWGGYEATEVDRGSQVVVATIQKLDAGVYRKAAYKWLSKAGGLVVDEAHSSIGQQYTRMLEWQGMERGKARVPLIGLTATPFRGTTDETKRLVSRYGATRLDTDALPSADAYGQLQELGVLSRVDHDLLPGSDLELSEEDLEALRQSRLLPAAAGRRLGADVERNRTLLSSILELDNEWPVLLFAASVEHAQTMAALLRREGVTAAAISGETDRGVRRHAIESFRRGEIRVLTNFAVLTAGFDAPKVRAVYVARPSYSANYYQQMIGRGLRGPLNGGTDRCLLVNVADNVLRFEKRLAFHEFDYLWSNSGAPVV